MDRQAKHPSAYLDLRHIARHWKLAALGLCMAAAIPVAKAQNTPKHVSCPGSPSLDRIDTIAARDTWFTLSGTDLLPGTTQSTLGTDLIGSPGLAGTVIKNKTVSFASGSGDTTGTVTLSVVNTDKGSCAMYYQASNAVTSTVCIDALQIAGFRHPKFGLVGDFRNDLVAGGIGSTDVSRSPGVGKNIQFNVLVCPGQVSRKLFLDTSVGAAKDTGTLRVRAADATLSAPIPTYVPANP